MAVVLKHASLRRQEPNDPGAREKREQRGSTGTDLVQSNAGQAKSARRIFGEIGHRLCTKAAGSEVQAQQEEYQVDKTGRLNSGSGLVESNVGKRDECK